MKTCKTGCGKMKAGGSVKKVKKMAKGGTAGIVGMPQYGSDPRTYSGRMLKKGGSAKSKGCPPGYYWTVEGCEPKGPNYKGPFSSTSSKIGVGTIIAGAAGMGIKKIADKIKEKKAAKKAAEEEKKKQASAPKAKFGASVGVKASCKGGMVRDANGKCVMSRSKFQKGGSSFGMLSVKAGVDKNPNPTAADRIAGAKMNKKKMGGTTRRK